MYCPTPEVNISCAVGEYCPRRSVAPAPCEIGFVCNNPKVRTPCAPGSFCNGSISNETSARCPPGKYCSRADEINDCLIGDFCPEGTFAAERSRRACQVGFYCPNTTVQVPCANGTYTNRIQSTKCIDCEANSFCTDTFQQPCPSNSFSPPRSWQRSQCICGKGFIGTLITEDDVCVAATNEFDITLTVIGSGIVFVVLVLLYFICNTDCAKKTFKVMLKDVLIVSFSIVGNWLNIATDMATFINIVLPNPDLDDLVYPVITVIIIGGITTVFATGVALWMLVLLQREDSETETEKMSFLVSFTKEFGQSKAIRLYEKYKAFHTADESDPELESNKEWRPVFDVLFRAEEAELESRARDLETASALPSKQVDSIMKVIRKIGREKQLLYVNAWILILQAIPMFIVTAWPIMSIAPERDIKGWIFRASLLLGAVVIGTKAAQVMDYFRVTRFEKRFRKQLYCTILSVKTRAYDPDPEVAGFGYSSRPPLVRRPHSDDLKEESKESRSPRRTHRQKKTLLNIIGNLGNTIMGKRGGGSSKDSSRSGTRKAYSPKTPRKNVFDLFEEGKEDEQDPEEHKKEDNAKDDSTKHKPGMGPDVAGAPPVRKGESNYNSDDDDDGNWTIGGGKLDPKQKDVLPAAVRIQRGMSSPKRTGRNAVRGQGVRRGSKYNFEGLHEDVAGEAGKQNSEESQSKQGYPTVVPRKGGKNLPAGFIGPSSASAMPPSRQPPPQPKEAEASAPPFEEPPNKSTPSETKNRLSSTGRGDSQVEFGSSVLPELQKVLASPGSRRRPKSATKSPVVQREVRASTESKTRGIQDERRSSTTLALSDHVSLYKKAFIPSKRSSRTVSDARSKLDLNGAFMVLNNPDALKGPKVFAELVRMTDLGFHRFHIVYGKKERDVKGAIESKSLLDNSNVHVLLEVVGVRLDVSKGDGHARLVIEHADVEQGMHMITFRSLKKGSEGVKECEKWREFLENTIKLYKSLDDPASKV